MNEMELQTTLDPIEMDMGDPEIVYSPVLPNPEGEPTDDLTKVTIQGNIYQIKDPEVHEWARAENKPTYTKAEVGLGNVDNTSDLDKPISTATQNALDGKVDNSELGNYYTKSEVNSALDNKADKSDTYTKTETDNLLSEKADSSSVYTKTETDTALDNKVDKVSGKGLSTNDYDDTAKGIVEGVTSALDNKVDKDGDKVLSDNNYSDTDKTKLDGIEEQANKTVVDNSVTATSTNPVESKAIYNLLNDLLPEAEETGNPISISNASGLNAKSLKVELEPIQDLHGYDKPWAGGSGKNKLPKATNLVHRGVTYNVNEDGSVSMSGTATNGTALLDIGRETLTLGAGTYYASITSSNATVTIFSIINGTASVIRNGVGTFTLAEPTSVFMCLSFAEGTTASGTAYPQIELGSTATTYEPYSNICPISGRTQTTVKRFGKNLYDNSLANGRSATASGLTFSCTDGLYKIQGLCNNATINAWILGEYNGTRAIFIIPKGTYILSVTDGRGVRIYSYDGTTRKFWDCKTTSQTPVTFNEDTPITAMKPVDHISGTTYNYTFHIQIEAGDTATDYEPYVTPVDTTISFGQTVYGGEVNVTSGGTSDEWGYIASYNGETLSGEWLSDRDKYVSGTTPTIGAEVVYKKTPTTINTPATSISLNKGNNTLSTSGDNMDLKYSTVISNPTSLSMGNPLSLSSPNLQTVTEPEEPIEE